ncbi:hypothetical protein [Streptomyces stelliscabiei]|uniref:hypothetical protein n=1 Tax=Streptomyces stelliscabiei TaxID=146820 RepID=UPI0029B1A890|nr:hypothetical protein [Streptomyces stelliscabiei]MDX2557995.1 hypothetical protein [Streptomyces stelliscabiei]MDX2617864.1 hypothetical protein [Streptomyces stelliscabiei]MDX2641954.1 hypothetical protein [Streptomyces stelliscabiei]MDX2667839.1 hypothetical protein [Streptomyces stelliscabiei]MDX2793940.1 hypothetical protein [Streptomyces stelliscabiei]
MIGASHFGNAVDGGAVQVSGEDLAEAFRTRPGRAVTYEATDPHAFFAPLAPMLGEQAAAAVADVYQALATQPDHSITAERSAQKILGVTLRTVSQWLAGIDLCPGSAGCPRGRRSGPRHGRAPCRQETDRRTVRETDQFFL